MLSKAYKEKIGVCLLLPVRSSIYTSSLAVNPNKVGSVDLGTVDPMIPKPLTAKTVPTLRSKTMPKLSPNFTGQEPCQPAKIFCWGLLSPGRSQCVRGQRNIKTTCTVTMRDHYTKTLIPASELGSAPMEVKVRGHKNIIITIT